MPKARNTVTSAQTASVATTRQPVLLGITRPDSTNSGFDASLIDGSLVGDQNIRTAGTIIKNRRIEGYVIVSAANVTLENCQIVGREAGCTALVQCNSTGTFLNRCTIKPAYPLFWQRNQRCGMSGLPLRYLPYRRRPDAEGQPLASPRDATSVTSHSSTARTLSTGTAVNTPPIRTSPGGRTTTVCRSTDSPATRSRAATSWATSRAAVGTTDPLWSTAFGRQQQRARHFATSLRPRRLRLAQQRLAHQCGNSQQLNRRRGSVHPVLSPGQGLRHRKLCSDRRQPAGS